MRKALSLTLALALLLSMVMITTVSAAPKIDHLAAGAQEILDLTAIQVRNSPGTDNGITDGTFMIAPQMGGSKSELRIPLIVDVFEDSEDAPITYFASNTLANGKVRINIGKKHDLLDSVSWQTTSPNSSGVNNGYLRVRFSEYFVSTKDQDFTVKITVSYGGIRQEIEIDCSYETDEFELDVTEGMDEVDISEGYIAVGEEFSRNVKVYTHENLYTVMNFFDGTKVYGVSLIDPGSSDTKLMNEYPEIELMFDNTKQIGLNGSNLFYFESAVGNYYVYGADNTYLGTTKDGVPYSAKYYLSRTMIDFGTDAEGEGEEPAGEEGGAELPETGGE